MPKDIDVDSSSLNLSNRNNSHAQSVRHLRASTFKGLGFLFLATGLTATGLFFSALALEAISLSTLAFGLRVACFGFGQLLLALAFVQWFVLLHECGHKTLFPRARANYAAGFLCSFFTGIPFASWRLVHGLHHKWTGWQDKDPTTAPLVRSSLAPLERFLINSAWASGFPLFTILYRTKNFWNLKRLFTLQNAPRQKLIVHSSALALTYALLLVALGPLLLLKLFGLGLFMSFVFLDPLMLSQHTHIAMPRAGDEDVRPLKAREQHVYTRTLAFPKYISAYWLVGFDLHEAHHVFPQVPGYALHKTNFHEVNRFQFLPWLLAVKKIRGEAFLFSNRDKTKAKV